jgi:hypothetical protein
MKHKSNKLKVSIKKDKVFGYRYTLKEKNNGWITVVIGTTKTLDECFDKIRKYLE